MTYSNDIENFENIPLDTLAEINRFSVRAINVCRGNELIDLESIILYFKKHGSFLRLRSIGGKTNKELCAFCENILGSDAFDYLIKSKNEQPEIALESDYFRMSIDDLTQYYNLSARAFNVCNFNKLHDLGAVLTYFIENRDFMNLRNIGRKTDIELCVLCKNILQDGGVNNLIAQEKEETNAILDTLTFNQDKLINQILKRESKVLSPRAINVLNNFFEGNITFAKLYAAFYNRARVAKLDLIGKKTEEELTKFIDLMENRALSLVPLTDEEVKAQNFLEILIDGFSLQPNEIAVYEVSLRTSTFPLFKFLYWLVTENKLLNERETAVLKARSGYFSDVDKLSLNELAEQFNITRERVRQIDYKTEILLSEALMPINTVKNDISNYTKYPIDFSKDVVHVRKSVVKEINDHEGCYFTPKFITKVFGYLHANKYDTIGLDLKHFDNIYLVDRGLMARFDFNAFFNAVQLQVDDNIDEDYILDFEGYLMTFLIRQEHLESLLSIKNVCEDILSSEYTEGVEVDWDGNIIFKRNTQTHRYELIKEVLEEQGEPMKLIEIYEILCEKHPEFMDKGIENFRSTIAKEKDIFIYFGRSSTYGLAKWEKERENVKGGTIRDIIEEFLNQSNEPQHVLAIKEYVATYRPETTCNSVNSTMLLKPDRFKDMTCWFYGIPSKTYSSFSCIKVPKFFNKRILEFIAANPDVSELEMTENLAEKYGLRTIQIKYYIQYCLEMGKLKRENGQLKYDENSISA
jgi:RNAse (barnase) inhibitor barstar